LAAMMTARLRPYLYFRGLRRQETGFVQHYNAWADGPAFGLLLAAQAAAALLTAKSEMPNSTSVAWPDSAKSLDPALTALRFLSFFAKRCRW
jgi:hypothetical protein